MKQLQHAKNVHALCSAYVPVNKILPFDWMTTTIKTNENDDGNAFMPCHLVITSSFRPVHDPPGHDDVINRLADDVIHANTTNHEHDDHENAVLPVFHTVHVHESHVEIQATPVSLYS